MSFKRAVSGAVRKWMRVGRWFLVGLTVIVGLMAAICEIDVASASDAAPLSGTALHQLVVAPPSPFTALPDDVLKTGLMEFGNPHSGKIGTVVSTSQLKRQGFQRGWESVFRSPDGAVIYVDVFECAKASGAAGLARAAQAKVPASYTRTPIDGLAGVFALNGVSPEGRSVSSAIYSRGRFFVFQGAGGATDAHDYQGLLADLARRQSAALPGPL
jgi:hypothetical protein